LKSLEDILKVFSHMKYRMFGQAVSKYMTVLVRAMFWFVQCFDGI
jgi:hypothetical protein